MLSPGCHVCGYTALVFVFTCGFVVWHTRIEIECPEMSGSISAAYFGANIGLKFITDAVKVLAPVVHFGAPLHVYLNAACS